MVGSFSSVRNENSKIITTYETGGLRATALLIIILLLPLQDGMLCLFSILFMSENLIVCYIVICNTDAPCHIFMKKYVLGFNDEIVNIYYTHDLGIKVMNTYFLSISFISKKYFSFLN